ncbi:MAG: sulfurtransferase complex subunit TusC [Gammaproteobacteria bacterium]|nr:sulfurtransferase complex subunit TusC [Gammaproteobacteria bacterium]MDA8022127.1 sulfurtransferase complex subunit TusC [Gammaproteobacteria bacterium]
MSKAQNAGAVKKFLYINRRAPHGSNYAQEGLEMAMVGAAFEQEVAIAFIDDGVFQLKRGQNPAGAGLKNFTAAFGALGDHDIRDIFVERESLEARGLRAEDLLQLVFEDEDSTEKSAVQIVGGDELAEIIARQDVLLNF